MSLIHSFFLFLLSPGPFILLSLPWSPSPSLLLSLSQSPLRSFLSVAYSALFLLRSLCRLFGDFFLLSISFSYIFFLFSSFLVSAFGFLLLSSVLSSPLPSLSSYPLSSSASSTDASVPKASAVSGVASSALGGGLDGSSSCGFSSVVRVPEDPLTVPDTDDPALKSCIQSPGFFTRLFVFFCTFRMTISAILGLFSLVLTGFVIIWLK